MVMTKGIINVKREDIKILKEIDSLWDDEFEFLNEDDFENIVLPYLRETTAVYKEARLSRKIHRSKSVTYNDGVGTLDEYYVRFINDSLRTVRCGEIAYIFNLEQVREILHFEPNTNFTLQDGIFYAYR